VQSRHRSATGAVWGQQDGHCNAIFDDTALGWDGNLPTLGHTPLRGCRIMNGKGGFIVLQPPLGVVLFADVGPSRLLARSLLRS